MPDLPVRCPRCAARRVEGLDTCPKCQWRFTQGAKPTERPQQSPWLQQDSGPAQRAAPAVPPMQPTRTEPMDRRTMAGWSLAALQVQCLGAFGGCLGMALGGFGGLVVAANIGGLIAAVPGLIAGAFIGLWVGIYIALKVAAR